jgi:hypothetical protein
MYAHHISLPMSYLIALIVFQKPGRNLNLTKGFNLPKSKTGGDIRYEAGISTGNFEL